MQRNPDTPQKSVDAERRSLSFARAVGRRIMAARGRRGLSQSAVGRAVGVDARAVRRWEQGRSLPCLERLVVLAELFSLPLDELVPRLSSPEMPAAGALMSSPRRPEMRHEAR